MSWRGAASEAEAEVLEAKVPTIPWLREPTLVRSVSKAREDLTELVNTPPRRKDGRERTSSSWRSMFAHEILSATLQRADLHRADGCGMVVSTRDKQTKDCAYEQIAIPILQQ